MTIVTKPNTFVANELIDANQMNQNFDSIYGSVNGNLDASNISVSGLNDLTKFANEVVTQLKTKGLIYTQDLFSQSFFVSGGLATFPGSPLNQISVTTATAYIIQADGSYRRVILTGTTYTTASISTTYYLDLQPDGTISWGTAHSGQTGYLSLATVTTNGSGNVNVVTDVRVLFTGVSWQNISKVGSSLADLATRLASDLLLTGYVSGAGAVAATDSVLAAIQKINGNDALKLPITTAASTYTPITGINWTSQINYPADNTWNSVCFGNGMFVAVASSGTGNRVMYSPDGVSWKTATYSVDNSWNSVCYGNGKFVAVSITGSGNRVMTSLDGINWTIGSVGTDRAWTCVTFGNGTFVAVCNDLATTSVMTSPDGITWTLRTAPARAFLGVAYGVGTFVAVSYDGTTQHVAISTDNGVTWTAKTTPIDVPYISVCFANGLFVVTTQGGTLNRIVTSPDGITWTHQTTPSSANMGGICYGGGMFVVVAQSVIMTSPDAVTWTLRTNPANAWSIPCYGNGMFVVVGQSGTGNRVLTSGNVLAPQDLSRASVNSVAVKSASVSEVLVTSTSLQVVATYTPTAQGNFFVGIYIRVITGTTTVTVTITYTDSTGAKTITVVTTSLTVGSYNYMQYINATAATINVNVTASVANQVRASASIIGS